INPTSRSIVQVTNDGVPFASVFSRDLDVDRDGLDDETEATLGTNPLLADTDRDGYSDGKEVSAGTDPPVSDGERASPVGRIETTPRRRNLRYEASSVDAWPSLPTIPGANVYLANPAGIVFGHGSWTCLLASPPESCLFLSKQTASIRVDSGAAQVDLKG